MKEFSMRIFKFRGKSLIDNIWVYGGGIDTQRDTPMVINHGNKVPVIASTIGLFTGFKTKEGFDIYEGDRLRWTHGNHFWEGVVSTLPQ